MNNKTLALVSYITLIGWLVAFFSSKDNRDPLVKYHLKQSFGLCIVGIIFNVVFSVLIRIIPVLSYLFLIIALILFVFLIIGILNANKGENKPLPVIGKMFEDKFDFI